MEALQKHSQPEDAAAVEQAIAAAQGCSGSLKEDIAVAQQALQRWQLTTSNEAKLAKALKDGTSVVGLSRAIQVSQPAREQSSTAMLAPGASSHCTLEDKGQASGTLRALDERVHCTGTGSCSCIQAVVTSTVAFLSTPS